MDPDYVGTELSTGRRHVWLPCAAPDLSPFQSLHTVEPKLFVLWGMDQNGDPISDAWELNINRMEWKVVGGVCMCVCVCVCVCVRACACLCRLLAMFMCAL